MAKGKKDGKASPKRKQPKDPHAPKRPQSAYFLWMNANRENIKKDLGLDKVDIGKIGKEAGRRWGEMTADDKKEWEEKANQARIGSVPGGRVLQTTRPPAHWPVSCQDGPPRSFRSRDLHTPLFVVLSLTVDRPSEMGFCTKIGSVFVGIGKKIIGFRLKPVTATMMVVSVQICLIVTALSLAFSYMDRDMASTVFGSADYRIFLLVYAPLASITSLLFLATIFVGLYGGISKLPTSGLFLHSQMWYKGATLLNNHTRENFERMIDATARLQTHRHAKTQPAIKVPYNLTHLHNTISEVQRTYCCCGLNGAEDYGPKFKPTHNVNWNLSVLLFIDDKVENMSCPSMQFDSKSSCAVALFRGCEWAILHTQINIVQWLSVLAFIVCWITTLLLPFIYRIFEA
ncbi:hypothetical protein WR25_01180, partial [Diploscapter pachys]